MSRFHLLAGTLLFLAAGNLFTGKVLAAQSTTTEPSATQIGSTETTTATQQDTMRQILDQWDIDTTEYARYQTLMTGPRGAFSVNNISPLEVLGIHARTPEERRRYADRLVRLMYEDTERVLAFEFEVQAAWKRLDQPMFDPARLPATAAASATAKTTTGKRLALFVSTDTSCEDCLSRTQALARRNDITGLDIYVTDTDDANAIRTFARQAGIVPKDVISKRITLNKGSALFALYNGNRQALPQTFVRDGKHLVPVSGFGRRQP